MPIGKSEPQIAYWPACNSVQCATAEMANVALPATENLKLTDSIEPSSVRIPFSPPHLSFHVFIALDISCWVSFFGKRGLHLCFFSRARWSEHLIAIILINRGAVRDIAHKPRIYGAVVVNRRFVVTGRLRDVPSMRSGMDLVRDTKLLDG